MRANTLTVKVARVQDEATAIRSFELVAQGGEGLPPFDAGAHIDVFLPGGLVRPYSLCGDPLEREVYRIAVLLESQSRGGSQAMHRLREGDELQIGVPRNLFPLEPGSGHCILVAGGIGITPLLSMAQVLARQGRSFELHGCARSLDRMAFLDRLRAADLAPHLRLHMDDGPSEQRLQLAELFECGDPQAQLYVCGPTGFMDWVLDGAQRAGWAGERLHREYFAPPPAASTAESDGFELVLAATGRRLRVESGETVVEVLHRAGVDLPVSCEQGLCGTCEVAVLEGIPDHRDHFLTRVEKAAGRRFLPCCSRSKSACLVLDL